MGGDPPAPPGRHADRRRAHSLLLVLIAPRASGRGRHPEQSVVLIGVCLRPTPPVPASTNKTPTMAPISRASVVLVVAVAAAANAQAPASAPASDGTSVDQGIAYVLMLVALVLTYLIHPLDASSAYKLF
ncbi:hypothetical protein PAHAL_5G221500 [Panicum hallii]|uniref:Arabinogalactan peptide 16 n=1 Tax=Panicum hallii TaxID=206008 RepID=A0A2T8IKU4_9POAL|nr:hypothetical protein PAHAL_5G221500 [Panicum hallii]